MRRFDVPRELSKGFLNENSNPDRTNDPKETFATIATEDKLLVLLHVKDEVVPRRIRRSLIISINTPVLRQLVQEEIVLLTDDVETNQGGRGYRSWSSVTCAKTRSNQLVSLSRKIYSLIVPAFFRGTAAAMA